MKSFELLALERWRGHSFGVPREARAQRNTVLFREVNERIRQHQTQWRSETDRVGFVCECGALGCTTRVYVTSAEYGKVRALGACFLVAPAHVDPDREQVVTATERFALVKRFSD